MQLTKYVKYGFSLCLLMLVGCNTTHWKASQSPVPENLFLDEQFNHSEHVIETEQEIFAVNDEMKRYVNQRLMPIDDPLIRAKQILRDLFSKSDLSLIYGSQANLTASETFDAGVANCLSLTIMTYALATQARLSTQFQDVLIDEYWTQSNAGVFLNGHVNLKINGATSNTKIVYFSSRSLIVDFMPVYGAKSPPTEPLDKQHVVALFYNNKGADALVSGEHDLAYKYFKEAIQLAPQDAAIFNNLALLYKRVGNIEKTEEVLVHALSLNPDNLNAKENLAYVYMNSQRHDQAQVLLTNIKKIRSSNPYYFLMLGGQDYYRGNYESSIQHLKKALKLSRDNHEIYFGLAKSYLGLGDLEAAEHYLKKARRFVKPDDIRERYQNKIHALRNMIAST
jgi:tetratricopeptide (TPR) repeat protein